ncbi:MAG: hypothetical protein CMO42_04550, partial [Verrucomicrobiales bacterium]|nr:hypothetical protein [Verrucomicrobiales bacterium]
MKNFFLISFFHLLTFFSAPFFYYGFGDTVLKEVRAMTLEEDGVLLIELGGTDFNQFDRIVVDEEVNLGGKLEVELIDGYWPNVGDEFEFMNFGESFSDFSEMSGLDLGDGLYLMPTLGLSSYKLRVIDSSPKDAVVSFNPDDVNDGSI